MADTVRTVEGENCELTIVPEPAPQYICGLAPPIAEEMVKETLGCNDPGNSDSLMCRLTTQATQHPYFRDMSEYLCRLKKGSFFRILQRCDGEMTNEGCKGKIITTTTRSSDDPAFLEELGKCKKPVGTL